MTLLYETVKGSGATNKTISSMRTRIMNKCSEGTDKIMLKQIGYIG